MIRGDQVKSAKTRINDAAIMIVCMCEWATEHGVGEGMDGDYPFPPICIKIVTPRHLFFNLLEYTLSKLREIILKNQF